MKLDSAGRARLLKPLAAAPLAWVVLSASGCAASRAYHEKWKNPGSAYTPPTAGQQTEMFNSLIANGKSIPYVPDNG